MAVTQLPIFQYLCSIVTTGSRGAHHPFSLLNWPMESRTIHYSVCSFVGRSSASPELSFSFRFRTPLLPVQSSRPLIIFLDPLLFSLPSSSTFPFSALPAMLFGSNPANAPHTIRATLRCSNYSFLFSSLCALLRHINLYPHRTLPRTSNSSDRKSCNDRRASSTHTCAENCSFSRLPYPGSLKTSHYVQKHPYTLLYAGTLSVSRCVSRRLRRDLSNIERPTCVHKKMNRAWLISVKRWGNWTRS